MRLMNMIFRTGLLTVGLLTAGCERGEQAGGSAEPVNTARATLPTDLFVDSPPADARSVGELKAMADLTGEVVVHGRIGGRVEPFVKGAAVFLLADMSMKACHELHEDECPTPWDYCCEPRESLRSKLATIQIVGEDGRPLPIDVRGQHDLTPLTEVTVAGEVAMQAEDGPLVINARRIYVKPMGG